MEREEGTNCFRAPSIADELTDLREGDVLCDRHRRDCYQIDGIGETSVGLHQDGTDFSVPRSLFVTWYGRRLFPVERSRGIDAPEWCSGRRERPGEELDGARTVLE